MFFFMEIEINTQSTEAVYVQIVSQISRAVQDDKLKPGHTLPPVRQLANDLMINPNTVAKAYKQLEAARVVIGAGRRGTYIADGAKDYITHNNNLDAKVELHNLMKVFQGRGLSGKEMRNLLFDQITQLKGVKP